MNTFNFNNWSSTGIPPYSGGVVFSFNDEVAKAIHDIAAKPIEIPLTAIPEVAMPTNRRDRYLAELARIGSRLPLPQRTPMGEVIKHCIQAKHDRNCRSGYLTELERMLTRFAKDIEDLPAALVSTSDVEQWLHSHTHWLPGTKRAAMSRLSAFFTFALKRGYVTDNPVSRFDRILVEQKTPRIFTPDEADAYIKAVRTCAKILLPGTIIGLYAGARSAEIQKLTWDDIDLDRAIIKIAPSTSKTRQRRIVPLEPKCVALLRGLEGQRLGIETYSQRMPRMRVAMKMGWMQPSNILRHSCASYWLALYQDPGKVAYWLGHSADVLYKHYRELVSQADCDRFWKI